MEIKKKTMESGLDSVYMNEYKECISDLISNDLIKSMKQYTQHGKINCLEHSLNVSFVSYKVCRRFGLDHRAAARGGLLHDFYLYDWHYKRPFKGLHGLIHPGIALKNAEMHFTLSNVEKDIINKHMWPLTVRLPKYKASFVVSMVDKYCAVREMFNFRTKEKPRGFEEVFEI